MDFIQYKRPIMIIALVIIALVLMIAIGFPLGILSQNPDGLERVLIDYNGESWLENLFSPWTPFLVWIENEYLAGIIGIILTTVVIVVVFYFIAFLKRRRREKS
ncbi:MAG: hypothetical protein ACFE8E_11130 [Candidatus Hodarchaeota archaeon]